MNYRFDLPVEQQALFEANDTLTQLSDELIRQHPVLAVHDYPYYKLPLSIQICPNALPRPVDEHFQLARVIELELDFHRHLTLAKARVRGHKVAPPSGLLGFLSRYYNYVERAYASALQIHDQRNAADIYRLMEVFTGQYPRAFAPDLAAIYKADISATHQRLLFWRFIEQSTTAYFVDHISDIHAELTFARQTIAAAARSSQHGATVSNIAH